MTSRARISITTGAVALFAIGTLGLSEAPPSEAELVAFFKTYDAAYNAKDLAKLGALYHPEVTVFEGSNIDRGWTNYRDRHLGPELRSFQNLRWSHRGLIVHLLGQTSAYVTAEYSLAYETDGRAIESGGIATHVLIKSGKEWRIRHSHTAPRRR